MSHLFKQSKKKYFVFSKLLIFVLIIYFFICGTLNYSGNILIYISFSIISNYLIFFCFRKNAIFFDTFFGILLWLGFWFKFTCTISFTDGKFREGVGLFNYSNQSFDQTLIISQIGILAFILAGIIREFFLFKYPKKISFKTFKYNLLKFHRKKIWFIFSFFFLAVGFINFYFNIYQKGLLPVQDINFLISGLIKWLLLFGLSSFSSIIIFLEFNFFKIFFLSSTSLIFLENFISSFSMLSRGMIFNSIALLFGIYKLSKITNKENTFNFYLKSLLFITFLFYISVSTVNYVRSNYFYVGKSTGFVLKKFVEKKDNIKTKEDIEKKKLFTLSKRNSEIFYLIINRWVGIDGVMAVISKKEILGFELFIKALKEKPLADKPTFYENVFGLEGLDTFNQIYKNVKGNTLPGIIAFMYYLGSYKLLFISIFFLSILASYIEFLAFKFSSENLIFSALIGQTIAFRFIHFGYLPNQSYLLFGSIFLTIIIFYIFMSILKKLK